MNTRTFLTLFTIGLALLSCSQKGKNPPVDFSDEKPLKDSPPRQIGIAFGGGGAKAAAEIGVLKVLEETGISIGYIAGSSMGAVVGGLYAAGYSANEVDSLFATEDWLSLFDKNELGITIEDYNRTVFGLIKGDEFERRLADALSQKGCYNIEDTEKLNHIKFSCTTTKIIDKERLEEYDLYSGNMAKAIRASITYPAPVVGYKAVEWNGFHLVDGGMLNNLPVDVVKKLGAKKVIAIDLEKESNSVGKMPIDLPRLRKVTGFTAPIEDLMGIKWLVDWLWDHSYSIEKRKENYNNADIKLRPDLFGYSILSFNERAIREMILAGEKEARSSIDDIIRLK